MQVAGNETRCIINLNKMFYQLKSQYELSFFFMIIILMALHTHALILYAMGMQNRL
jgi:hypothetical protein